MKRTPTPAQKAKAEERRAKLKDLWAKVAAMSEDERANLAEKVGLIATCEGWQLSAGNTILLTYQRENVTVVGGYQQWRGMGRQVRKGESSLGIWIPKIGKDETEVSYFIFGSVFDITQTDPTNTDDHTRPTEYTEKEYQTFEKEY